MKKGKNMKTLILLLSFIFILCSGCGGETEGGEEDITGGGETTKEEGTTGGDNNQSGPPVFKNNPDPTISPTTPPTTPDPCAPFVNRCKTNEECGAKYNQCLRPKAGDPARTETVVCTKEDSEEITLTFNEWDATGGGTNLLCDTFENDSLYPFATLVKNTCKNHINQRKQELTKSGYKCQ